MDNNCIFCKLANGVFPTATVYEDDCFRAILDVAPCSKGHTLVIPKQHMEDLLNGDEECLAKALGVVKKTANAVKKTLGCDGINILQNNGEAAGQSVFHLHFHIIPRYKDDNLVIPWNTLSYEDGEADTLAGKISENI